MLSALSVSGCDAPVGEDGLMTMPVIPFVFPTPIGFGMAYEDVKLETPNGETLYAWFIPAENPRGTILVNHGAVFTRSWPLPQIAVFHDLGCNVMVADYQGFADSTGTPRLDTVLSDANTSLAYLRECPREGTDKIILFGLSMGTMIAMAQGADAAPDIAGMIIEGVVQPDVLEDIGFEFMGIRPSPDAYTLIPSELDPQAAASRINVPKLFMQTAEDAITPYEGALRLFDDCPEPKRFVTVTGIHGLGIFFEPRYSEIIESFLDEFVPRKGL